ncbi:serine/arginine repetitive matrix protein 2 [Cocos nucifera]|uniref:Serine/arginine repetitive matrix protein 2 n=1 Tax=Cocos nucifera TaxID=13894 RepID=A0A8K0IBP2_COCNU|nr:serine/arginine repetitive matrix protein 2 [Cocos nucifera]
MRTGFSSKHSKKNSDEERSKKKKMRSTKRRRHDSSSSSYSSGSEIDARSRKKRNQREPKRPEKMRKESNKPVKKKSRKTRYRRDASLSSSSRSCSTCRGRSSSSGGSESDSGRSRSRARGNKKVKLRERIRSRSPPRADRKAKLRGRSRSSSPPARADRKVISRDRSRSKGRERRRSRRMSSKRDGGRYLSRSCSSCEGRSRSSREEKGKEVDQPKRLKSALVVTKESEEMETLGSRSYSESQSHSEGKGKEVDQPRQLKSALVVTKESEEMEGIRRRDKIIQCYDDLGRSVDAYEQALDDRQVELGGEKHSTDTWVEDTAYVKGDKHVLTKLDTEPAKNADFGNYDSTRKISGDSVNAGSSEPEDLELLLRQKALANFRKFRGGFLAQKNTSGDQKDESIQTELCKDAGRFDEAKDTIVSSNCKSTSSLECQASIQGGIPMTQPRIRSIVNIPTENGDGNSIICCQNASESSRPAVDRIVTSAADGQTTPNHLKSKEEPLDKLLSGKTLSAKDIQDKMTVAEPGSSATIGDELKIADGSASGASACLNVKNGNKLAEEDTTGSHFEQKTFSRMHDGEMVQVSYKVYIPNKSPALARRQLQR